ncbi:MAG TPA: signal peptidase II [Myxococcaceae bacterium]|nr:signal peptidase II [Myxococcaceae bacterium]
MRQRLLLLIAIAVPILIADQATKAMVVERFGNAPEVVLETGAEGSAGILVAEGLLSIRPIPNPDLGASTGFLVRALLLGSSLLALVFLVWLTLGKRGMPSGAVVGLSALIGGAAGNLMDRLVRGHVLDWLHWHGPGTAGASFTVGDVGIWSGVALLLVELVRSHDGPLGQPAATPPALPGV